MSSCPCGFCHLHVHSEYSLLDGANRIGDIAKRAAEMDMPAAALTDHGVMYGAIEHYEACKEQGIKPIIGVEAYVAPRKHTDKDSRLDSQKLTNHLTLWAKNRTGYKNLVKLTTRANIDGFYYRPRVDHELLAEYSEGIICGSACLGGEIPQFITKQKLGEAQERAEKYREIFGQENFFLPQSVSRAALMIVAPVFCASLSTLSTSSFEPTLCASEKPLKPMPCADIPASAAKSSRG